MSCWRAQSQHVFSFRSRWDLVRYRTFCSVPFLSNWFCSFWFVLFRSVPFCFFPFLSVSFCSLPFLLVRFVPSLICDVLFRSGMCLFFYYFSLLGGISSDIALLHDRTLPKPYISKVYLGSYSRGAVGQQDRRHLFVTPCFFL